ncbi:hypothetical protein DENIS_2038 [Desulfonema ishimotonii]|uniref:Cyclic nucleotide-binding domain-containing protein n=1 Tax=Desulfonema ishimotonii TaxID=45657 RepID=A0A401FVU5_9BACT|nr:cyclic nucleotide-binding domain-containing protein [Desulfonema ishimotonii]GBC61078.1 hypothetical protein DENIS_2038 [Desulfonema ishimotonii]
MSDPKSIVKIIGTQDCPMYGVGDEFRLSGKSLTAPYGKATCMILVRDITEVVLKYECIDNTSRYVFDCSGCAGLARLEYKCPPPFPDSGDQDNICALTNALSRYTFFQIFDEESVRHLVSLLKMKRYESGDVILTKGEPGKNLYIIISGRVDVLADSGIRIAGLGKGEVFGEMSLISGGPVSATVRAIEPLSVLYLEGRHFKEILSKSPSVQIYLTRMLARRIANTNVIRSQDFASAMTGNISEIPTSELFQTLHLNHKTGVLILKLADGLAAASFREGRLIRAKYGDREDKAAFFEMLKAREGRFKFHHELPPEEIRVKELGNFMKLLMEGVKNADEMLPE